MRPPCWHREWRKTRAWPGGSGGRYAVWSLRSDRGGCGRSRKRRRRSGRGYMVWTFRSDCGRCMRSRHRRRSGGGRYPVWSLRSNRGGCGRSRKRRRGSGRGHMVRTRGRNRLDCAGAGIRGNSVRAGNLRRYPLRSIIHKRRGDVRPRGRVGNVVRRAEGTRGRPWRAFAYTGRRDAGPARRFSRDPRSGRRGISRGSRIEFVGKAGKLRNVGKIAWRSVQCAHPQRITWRIHACSHDICQPRHFQVYRPHPP
jgi:hypothetical protein